VIADSALLQVEVFLLFCFFLFVFFAGEILRIEASVEECSEEVQEAPAEVPQL